MSLVLIGVPALPLLAALLVVAADFAATQAARVVTVLSGASLVAAIVVLVSVGVDGPIDAVIERDGAAVVGFTADRVGAVLLVLTTLVGLIVQAFATRSLRGDARARRFHVLAAVLAGSTTAVAVAATGSSIAVAWIATSVALVALLGHKAPWAPAVAAQRITARAFAIGDIALVIGVVIALATIGDLDLRRIGGDAIALDQETIVGVNALEAIAVLLVVAGVARSALVPLHRWLPATLAAPTPVSALLHAGVVNGAGVLLIRFSPVFGSSVAALALAFVLGIATALIATAVMLVRTDVKGGLVWSTSGQMGFMVMQLGVGAFAAALFHIVGHALYKAALFLGAGGAISAHHRQVQRPHLGRDDAPVLRSTPVLLGTGLVVPLAAFAIAFLVIDPHLTAAATILVTVFGTLSLGRAANGWMRATPFPTVRTVSLAVIGVIAGAFVYIGGIALFEAFVVDVVPYEVPAAVGPVWVAVTLGGLFVAVSTIVFLPGTRGDELRREVYGWLLSTGAAPPSASGGDDAAIPESSSSTPAGVSA